MGRRTSRCVSTDWSSAEAMKLGSAPKNCFQAVPHELHITMRDVFGTRMDGMRYPSRQVGQKMSIGMAPAALRSWPLFFINGWNVQNERGAKSAKRSFLSLITALKVLIYILKCRFFGGVRKCKLCNPRLPSAC